MLLKLEKLIKGHRQGQEGLAELRQAVKYLQIFGILDRVFLDIGISSSSSSSYAPSRSSLRTTLLFLRTGL
jgi:hypothetical protein